MQTQAGEMTCGGESVSFSSIISVSLKCCISSHWIQEGGSDHPSERDPGPRLCTIFFLPVCFPPQLLLAASVSPLMLSILAQKGPHCLINSWVRDLIREGGQVSLIAHAWGWHPGGI